MKTNTFHQTWHNLIMINMFARPICDFVLLFFSIKETVRRKMMKSGCPPFLTIYRDQHILLDSAHLSYDKMLC